MSGSYEFNKTSVPVVGAFGRARAGWRWLITDETFGPGERPDRLLDPGDEGVVILAGLRVKRIPQRNSRRVPAWDPTKAWKDLVEAVDVGGDDRDSGVDGKDRGALFGGPDVARPRERALRKDHNRPATGQMLLQAVEGWSSAARARNRKGADQELRQDRFPFALEDGVGGGDHEGAESETGGERLQHHHRI